MEHPPAETNNGGRPRIIDSPEEFDRLVEDYALTCREHGEPPTFSGMARHLGFASRRSLYDYEKLPGFSHSVARAKLLVEAAYERRLHDPGSNGAQFALKNHGWTDRTVTEQVGADGGPIRHEVEVSARERLRSRIEGIRGRLAAGAVSGAESGGVGGGAGGHSGNGSGAPPP